MDLSDRDFHLVYLIVVVLLPLLPAYLLFKSLPSRADVGGPWQGLQLKLGGAFAGYFAIVLLITTLLRQPSQSTPASQVWTVDGKVLFEDELGADPDFVVLPAMRDIRPDGDFTLKVVRAIGESGKRLQFPKLTVIASGYYPQTVRLDEKANIAARDSESQTIHLKDIVLKRPRVTGEYDLQRRAPEQVPQ